MPARQAKPSLGLTLLWSTSLLSWLSLSHLPTPPSDFWLCLSYLPWSLSAARVWREKAVWLVPLSYWLGILPLLWANGNGVSFLSSLGALALHEIIVVIRLSQEKLQLELSQLKAQAAQSSSYLQREVRARDVGRLYQPVYHELKNQISVSFGYLEQFRDNTMEPQQFLRKLERMEKAQQKMLELLDELGHWQSQSLGNLAPASEGIDVRASIQRLLEKPLSYYQIELNNEVAEPMWLAVTRKRELRDLLVHLLLNIIQRQKLSPNPQPCRVSLSCLTKGERMLWQWIDPTLRKAKQKPEDSSPVDFAIAFEQKAMEPLLFELCETFQWLEDTLSFCLKKAD